MLKTKLIRDFQKKIKNTQNPIGVSNQLENINNNNTNNKKEALLIRKYKRNNFTRENFEFTTEKGVHLFSKTQDLSSDENNISNNFNNILAGNEKSERKHIESSTKNHDIYKEFTKNDNILNFGDSYPAENNIQHHKFYINNIDECSTQEKLNFYLKNYKNTTGFNKLVKFKRLEFLTSIFLCRRCKSQSLVLREEVFNKIRLRIRNYFDVNNFLNLYQEFQKFKNLILNENQSVALRFLKT